jgi:hypothetical protein
VTWEEFGKLVIDTFGPGLERTNYGSVHSFCAEVREKLSPSPRDFDGALLLVDEPAAGFDDVMRSFFESSLRTGADEAAIQLWLYAFETWYSERESDEDRFRGLMGEELS